MSMKFNFSGCSAAALCKSFVALGVLALPLTPSTAAVQSLRRP